MWFTTRYYWYQFSSWFKPYSVKVLSFLIQKLSLFFNLNQIRVSELSIVFNLSYLNDLTRSRRKGLLFVQVNQDTRSAQIPQKQHGSNTYILKTHHLTNLWVIHFKERVSFWPCVRAPLQTENLFSIMGHVLYIFYFSITLFVVL